MVNTDGGTTWESLLTGAAPTTGVTYFEEGDAARVDSSAADVYLDFDDADFAIGTVGNEGNVTVTDGGVNHDATTNFVANEHIDWTNTAEDLTTTGDVNAANVIASSTVTGVVGDFGSLVTPYQQTVTVAKAGGDFTTIQGAIDSITDNSSSKIYTILIYPGQYNETLVLEDYVYLKGMCNSIGLCPLIYSNTGTVITNSDGSTNLSNLYIKATPTGTGVKLVDVSASTNFYDCTLFYAPAETYGTSMNVSAGRLLFERSVMYYVATGATAGTNAHIMLDATGSGRFHVKRSRMFMKVNTDADDDITLAQSNSSSTTTLVMGWNEIDITSNGDSFSGTVKAFNYIDEVAVTHHLVYNFIDIDAVGATPAGTAYAFYLDSNGNTSQIESSSNYIYVADFGTNYCFFADTGDVIVTHFDDIVASDEIQSGIVNTVSSFVDSELSIQSGNTNDPTLHFKTTNTPNEVNFYLDEGVTDDIMHIAGQTASVDTELHFKAQDGENAVLKLFSGSNSGQLKYGSNDELTLKNNKLNENINFMVDDGGVDKTIIWNAADDKLEHSAGTFNFDDDNLTTTGDITAVDITSSGTITGVVIDTNYIEDSSDGVLKIRKTLDEVVMSGDILAGSDISGIVTLGGTEGTYNEDITFDCDQIDEEVVIDSNTITVGQYRWLHSFLMADYIEVSLGTSQDFTWTFHTGSGRMGIDVGSGAQTGYVQLMDADDLFSGNRDVSGSPSNHPIFRCYSADAAQAADYIQIGHDADNANIDIGNGDLEFNDSTGELGEIGRGTTDTDITYLKLYNASGGACYVYPSATKTGVIVSGAKP